MCRCFRREISSRNEERAVIISAEVKRHLSCTLENEKVWDLVGGQETWDPDPASKQLWAPGRCWRRR